MKQISARRAFGTPHPPNTWYVHLSYLDFIFGKRMPGSPHATVIFSFFSSSFLFILAWKRRYT